MKPKLVVITLTAIALLALASRAQTNAPSGDTGQSPPAAAPATPAPEAAATPTAPAAPAAAPTDATTNATAPAATVSPTDGATNAAAPAAAATPAETPSAQPVPAATTEAPSAQATPAATLEVSHPGDVMPLVVMDEVPLTDAIKNLARRAGLNYILDPKVNYGQPGPDGRIVPQPSVSIRWENVTAEQALYALLSTYSLQLVEDPKSKIYRITVKDPAAPEPLFTKVIQLKYASPSNVLVACQNTLTDRRSKVVADVRTSQLVVLGTEKELSDVESLVASLDLPTRQVLIEARLIEMSANPQTKKGIDWTPTLQAQNISYGNGLSAGHSTTTIPGLPQTQNLPGGNTTTTTPNHSTLTTIDTLLGNAGFGLNTASGLTPNIGFLSADGVKVVLSFINQDSTAKVLSAPRTVTLDNEPSRIEVTRASPIINVTAGTANTTGGSQITYTNLGVILNVTPRISANDMVNLKVVPEVSRIFDTITRIVGTTAGTGAGGASSASPNLFQADEYDVRKIETRVIIPSGNTLVLGGLVADDVRDSSTKVPVFGDMPILGAAFRSTSKNRQRDNLLIFVTPTIVKDEDYQPTSTDFLKTPVVDSVESKWSVWDTAKPLDWSRPLSEQTKPTPSSDMKMNFNQ